MCGTLGALPLPTWGEGWGEGVTGLSIDLAQFARVTRHPELPEVPTARELALNDAARALIEFAEAPLLTMARPFAAPPDVPEERARALQAAFMATHRDAGFLAEVEKLGLTSARLMLAL
jgi:hypothetical protein